MVKMTANYEGEKHCEIVHGPSNAKISTDAPKDNHGKGESFSPTDLMGAALVGCILTTMDILSANDKLELKGAWGTVEKEMTSNPRRIAKLHVILHLPKAIPQEFRSKLATYAENCPVKLSLNSNLETPTTIHYDV